MEFNSSSDLHEHYLLVHGKPVSVSEETYKMVRAQNNHIRWLMRKEFRCSQVCFSHCNGDCFRCRYLTIGKITSLDTLTADMLPELASDTDIEADYIRKESWDRLLRYANRVVKKGAVLLYLRFVQGLTFQEIATELNVSVSTVHRRTTVLLKKLKSREDFF